MFAGLLFNRIAIVECSPLIVGNISYPCSPILDCLNVAKSFSNGIRISGTFVVRKELFIVIDLILPSRRFEENQW